MNTSTCKIEIMPQRALKAPFTRSLYPGAREIEAVVSLNTQSNNYETHIRYMNDVIKDRYTIYAFVGKYLVEPFDSNKQVRLIEYN